MQTNILEYLEHTVRQKPGKIAFTNGETGLTFQEVSDQARAIGSFLHREGFYKQPVVVFMQKQPRTLAAFFGAVYGGNYYVPLDEEMPRHRIELIFQTLQPGALICDGTTRRLLSARLTRTRWLTSGHARLTLIRFILYSPPVPPAFPRALWPATGQCWTISSSCAMC